jgi:tetratricopeptide (TPR) repeat protein
MSTEAPTLTPRTAWACLGVFVVVALCLYFPALGGPFISDDRAVLLGNPYVHGLSFENLVAILSPSGPVARLTANYAPVHMLAHATEWQIFGMEPLGFHVVNVLSHAVASTLLVLFFVSSGIARPAALLLGTLFLVHPANVEAVAWIFQLKTSLALAFSLGALLLLRERPALALTLFALALLTKITAAYALPVAALVLWVRGGERRAWRWFGAWTLVGIACVLVELAAFRSAGPPLEQTVSGPWEQARLIVAIASRYLVMSFTSSGVSAFHEPDAPESFLDGWLLSGLVLLALLTWRLGVALRRRGEEALYWTWAAVSFAPISQVFPFIYPMADRYLYFILPGLLGGAYFAVREALARAGRALGSTARADAGLARGALLALAVAVALLAAHASQRTPLWRNAMFVDFDAARNYPEGKAGLFLAARRAVERGNPEAALDSLQKLADRGCRMFEIPLHDPLLGSLRGSPRFHSIIGQMAENFISTGGGRRTQTGLHMLARAHAARGDLEAAIQALQDALELGGALDEMIRADLASLGVRGP